MSDSERNDISLRHEFKICEDIIKRLETGMESTKDLQDQLKQCEEKLKLLTKEVSTLSLFSNNESVDELPTSSLNYLFLPYYLATVTQNIIIYLQDFLRRLKAYNIIDFDLSEASEDNERKKTEKSKHDINLSKQRELKLQRFQREKELEELVKNSQSELCSNSEDEDLVRELIINRLHLAARKSVDEMGQIDQERPMVEHMLKIQTGEIQALPKRPMNRLAQTPYIIARDQAQKKIFGLGYPSVPTMTVNEWYDDMVRSGRFGALNPSTSENISDSNPTDEGAREEEEERACLQRWDEYKDNHRRGWGNMHNKG
ncbi:unnamed protein product [Litomosoides sigmodontis]|uniref:TAP42-like family protein n=1 Tax=Litomosoides sigmodontis TaxID=42156 RepID=A0A3P6SH21_LITSI|nr:unnamed protein product [Litomosoides sigmodontis]